MFKQDFLGYFCFSLCIFSNPLCANFPSINEFPGTLEVGLTGGYLRLSPDFRIYGIKQPAANLLSGPSTVVKVNPKYRFGGGFDVVYGCSYKLNLNYFETSNTTSRLTEGPVGTILTPGSWNDTVASGNAFSELISRYRFATVSVSNPFPMDCLTLIPSVGLSFLYLQHSQNTQYLLEHNAGVAGVSSSQINLNSKFNGFGLTFAANFGYEFCKGFSVIGGLQYSPLLGSIRGKYSALRASRIAGTLNTDVSLSYKTQYTIVNHTQSELGLGYKFDINQCIAANISIVYRFVKIIGARETNLYLGLNSPTLENQITNSVLHGPLLRFAIKY